MSSDLMIDRLVHELAPVRPRKARGDALILGGAVLAELALVLSFGTPRADLADAVSGSMFWWKMLSCLALAVAGSAAALAALDPVTARRGMWKYVFGAVGLSLFSGVMLEGRVMLADPMSRLNLSAGLHCLQESLMLALPIVVVFLWLARRAAPTRPIAAATATGVAAAGWGVFTFAWSCPYADPLYVLVWYGGAVVLGAVLARLVLPQALRW